MDATIKRHAHRGKGALKIAQEVLNVTRTDPNPISLDAVRSREPLHYPMDENPQALGPDRLNRAEDRF